MQDHSQTKEKIMRFLRFKGPSIPVYISKEIGQSILFTSAFLSELLGEKKIKTSNMRMGSSPVYFIPGQEPQLEKYSEYLKGKEKEAFFLLKEKKFLEDSEQHPAIRVALREIKDFAIPFEKNNKLYWRYFKLNEKELDDNKVKVEETKKKSEEENQQEESKEKKDLEEKISDKNEVEIFDKKKENEQKEEVKEEKPKEVVKKKVTNTLKGTRKKSTKKKSTSKASEKFFNRIKDFLFKKNIEIIEIESFGSDYIVLKINEKGEQKILIAYNKKRMTEKDFLNAHKKIKESGLKYILLAGGNLPKKVTSFIEAVKNLERSEKFE